MDSGMSYCDEKLAINYHKLVKLVKKKNGFNFRLLIPGEFPCFTIQLYEVLSAVIR